MGLQKNSEKVRCTPDHNALQLSTNFFLYRAAFPAAVHLSEFSGKVRLSFSAVLWFRRWYNIVVGRNLIDLVEHVGLQFLLAGTDICTVRANHTAAAIHVLPLFYKW